jgi:hypothetical protein
MRGLRRAYDPHLAVHRWHQLFSSRLVWVWGSTPPFRGGAKWGIDPAFGELLWAPNGDVPPFYRGG